MEMYIRLKAFLYLLTASQCHLICDYVYIICH